MIINSVTPVTSIFLFNMSIYFIYNSIDVIYYSKYIICVYLYSINSGILEVTQVTNLIIKQLSVTSCNLYKTNYLIINKNL